ncbi:DUF805 domain-containing protein [Asticcacaulis machinosus]|uniref:DUF805 domain-containing protein n=1 Tax=Asticcacaulis machinosus TaxID=2984211 RepID=A0ABT5HH79_9CAUL|nr:DUF805 domain-containing protein [Asticcacaulis machinosus]MDC7675607.1 DUF805 domain-containing protein [Asticcacaulis machinosus]
MSALKFLFSTQGRVTRLPFILFVVGLRVITEGLAFLIRNYYPMDDIGRYGLMLTIPGLIGMITLWPVFAVTVKRLHDINWSFAPAIGHLLVPIIGFTATFLVASLNEPGTEPFYKAQQVVDWIMMAFTYYLYALLLILSIVKGTRGPNRYGPAPKGKDDTAEAVF